MLTRSSLPLSLLCCLTLGCEPTAEPSAPAPEPSSPRLHLRLSGHLEGSLEPCGCASGQIGGLARRSFRIKSEPRHDLLIEGGNLTLEGHALDELKLLTILNILNDKTARYDVVAIGPQDLRIDPEFLGSYLEAFAGTSFVSADLVPREGLPWAVQPSFDKTAESGATARIVALTLSLPDGDQRAAGAFTLRDPQAAWTAALEGASPDRLRVLLAHGPESRVRGLAELEPRPDLLVAINSAQPEPPRDYEIVGGVPLVNPGTRGRYLLDVTLTRGEAGPRLVGYEAVALSGSRTAKGAMEDPATHGYILQHRHDVKEDGSREALADRLPTANGATYAGNSSCVACHGQEHEVWKNTRHAQAWQTLETAMSSGRYPWPVTHYPDCVQCHTVGYQQKSGFVNPERTPDLLNVGCEQCHGAGAAHVADPESNKLGKVSPDSCTSCHDFEQSPDFDYPQRWKAIEHGGD